MPQVTRHLRVLGCLAATVWLSACEPKHVPSLTVADLLADRVLLDGVLLKCNQDPGLARTSSDCANARKAIERLAEDQDPADQAKRDREFARRREQLRAAQDLKRREVDEQSKVDPYTLPVLPAEDSLPATSSAPVEVPAAPTETSATSPGLAQADH